KNYRTKCGEIDIIAKDKDTYCFIEVKTRRSTRLGMPPEAVGRPKQKHLAHAALFYLKENDLLSQKARFDVVSIVYPCDCAGPVVEVIRDAFALDGRFTY
ncbi:MAG: YraN family protein, partial [Candidatus Omnitrophica bacterium]|nr:YraN family protein [Candidatus Omnitrophota bacterium]